MVSVAVCNTENRAAGVRAVTGALDLTNIKGRAVLIKPNFNTADPAPASTHNDALVELIKTLWSLGAGSISLGERSHPPTAEVIAAKDLPPILDKLEVKVIDFDDLPPRDWVEFKPEGSHWPDGFRVARPIVEADCLVETCCLKTHQYGGVFTLSLKLAVGCLPAARNGFELMKQLHGSPHQRLMIAEINQAFSPELIVLDGVDAFVDGGPASGTKVRGKVMLASADRVAIDAAAVAALKDLGANEAIMGTRVFEHDQIRRAAELGLGVASPADIDLLAVDRASQNLTDRLRVILDRD